MADVSTWSTTAGSNNSASPDGWPESMPPSGVNNSARENMAQIATWRQKFGAWMMENVGLTATVGSGNLTITLRVKDGSTSPSSTNKVGIGFRSSTLTSGGFSYVEATSGIDVTLPSGGTLGFANSATGYVFVYAINNAGTMELAIAGQSFFDEGILYSTTAIGTGSDSSGVLYSTSTRTNVAVRLIGRVTIQHGTASWTNSPTIIALWTPQAFPGGLKMQTGSFTTSSLSQGSGAANTISHSLGTDNVILFVKAQNAVTVNETTTSTWSVKILLPDGQNFKFYGANADPSRENSTLVNNPPSSGQIKFLTLYLGSGAAQSTVTVNYTIFALD